MVNVGTGNLVVQREDMNVPHKGIPFTFRRTYNSQSLHDVNGDDGTRPAMYGNGWTNTFDAHVIKTSPGHISVYDDDGARYDYVSVENTNDYTSVTAGQHAVLAWDGGCGFTWTKKSGITYYFYRDAAPGVTCAGLGTIGAYAGKLHQIIGRNTNTTITLNYSWDGGNAGTGGKISAIDVQTESGLTATMTFTDVNGHRLLHDVLFPDRLTSVLYNYDADGNLSAVTLPPNNGPAYPATGGMPIVETYGYNTAVAWGNVGPGWILSWAASPRWWGACMNNACGTDGGYTAFGYGSGRPLQTVALTNVERYGIINPTISDDGTPAGPVQPRFGTQAMVYSDEYFGTGVTSPTFRDSDGHEINWVVDASARPSQVQVSTGPVTYGGTTFTAYLTTNETWDGANNLIAVVDARGYETDAAYDPAGNVVAIAEPAYSQTVGYDTVAYHPTRLYDYDGFNNITASCDQTETHPNGNWNGQYSGGSDSYCTSLLGSANHQRLSYTYPSYEPYGELTTITAPSGYSRTLYYDAAPQGGSDFGLPTRIAGVSVQQFDSSNRQPGRSVAYDANGNVVCVRADSASAAATVTIYDALGRVVASGDPDDASLTSPACSKTPGLTGSSITTQRTYYQDGSLATSRTPSQIAAGYGTAFTYDYDGDPRTEALYHPAPQNTQTPTIKRWYDAADRLIESAQPADPATSGDVPLLMRYVFDLTQSGSPTTLSGATVAAHGGLYEVQKNAPSGWIDFKYSAFDAADRVTTSYAFAPCPAVSNASGAIYCSQSAYATQYVWNQQMLWSITDGLGQLKGYTYDNAGHLTGIGYSGDGGVTPSTWYSYDPNGRVTSASNSTADIIHPNTISYQYSADGQLSQVRNDSLSSTTSYSYYQDAMLAGVSSVTGSVVNQPNLYRYAYRNDGLLVHEAFGASNQSVTFSFTSGERRTGLTDFGAGPSVTAEYDGHGLLSSLTTPAGSYTPQSYNSEGRILQYAGFNGETVTSQYDVRGDLIGRAFQPNPTGGSGHPSYPAFQYKNVQGVLVQSASDQYDGRTGAPLVVGSYPMTYDAVGRMSHSGAGNASTYTYDAENRLITGDTATVSAAGDAGCASGGVLAPGSTAREISYAYDGQGMLNRDVFSAQSRQNTRQWYWDRGSALYTVTSGQLDGYVADGMGSIPAGGASPGLTISDPDFDGAIALHHNMTGHSTWVASNAYHQECVAENPVPASPNYVGPNANPVLDDESDPGITVTSVGRAYLSRANGFTTPDYSSSTPYASERGSRSPSDYCVLLPDGYIMLVKDTAEGKHIDACAQNRRGTSPPSPQGPNGPGGPGAFGTAFKPLPKIQPCLPLSAVNYDQEFRLPISIGPTQPFSGGYSLTLTNSGTVWLSPSFSVNPLGAGGISASGLFSKTNPGQTPDDIASGASFGGSILIGPGGSGGTASANSSGAFFGPAMGTRGSSLSTSYGLFYWKFPLAAKIFCH